MTTAATTLLGLALPVTGELQGTWGDTVNNSITNLLDTAVAGTTTLSTDGDVTLTTTTLAANQARQAILLCSGARTALRTITAPAQSKIYTIINATTGGYSVKLVGAGPTTGVTIVAGESALVAWNGSDFIKISNTAGGGTFTDLTVSNSLTLSGGTANGVLYLNGSKVATSGSALTFNGTQLGVTNGAGSAIFKLDGTSAPEIDFYSSGAIKSYIYAPSTSLQLNTIGSNPIIFLPNEVEGMRLTSTGLGIGTTSPGAKLDIGGTNNTVFFKNSGATTGYALATISNTSGAFQYGISSSTGTFWGSGNAGNYSANIGTTSATNLGFGTSDTLRMLLDSSGNLVVGGTTATNTAANRGNISINGASNAILSLSTGNTARGYVYHSGSDMIINATTGTLALQANGNGALIDSSGNLGLGVTPSASTLPTIQSAYGVLSGNTNISIVRNAYYNGGWKYTATAAATFYQHDGGSHIWYNAPSGTAGNAITFTQAMTLDASGNLAVGTTTTTTARLRVDGSNGIFIAGNGANGYNVLQAQNDAATGISVGVSGSTAAGWSQALAHIGTTSNSPLALGTNSIERARIDSSGNLLVGTTSGAERLVVSGTTNNYVIKSVAPSTSGTYYHIVFDDAGTSHGSITSNGTTTAYNTSSDYRLKDNQQPLTGSGAFIDALQPKTWDWKADGSKGVGFIAHEVQAVSPNSVVGVKDAVDEEGKPIYQAMEYGSAEFIANIIAELQSLRKRLADAGIA